MEYVTKNTRITNAIGQFIAKFWRKEGKTKIITVNETESF